MIFKVISSGYRIVWTIKRYERTFPMYRVPEVWFLVITLVKLIALLPAYWYRQINFMYAIFLVNSLSCYWLNYLLLQRMCVALDQSLSKVKWNKYGFIFQITMFVANIFVAPLWEAALKREEFKTSI